MWLSTRLRSWLLLCAHPHTCVEGSVFLPRTFGLTRSLFPALLNLYCEGRVFRCIPKGASLFRLYLAVLDQRRLDVRTGDVAVAER